MEKPRGYAAICLFERSPSYDLKMYIAELLCPV